MSRLCVLKLCPVIKNIGTLETLLSRMRLKSGDRLNATCWSCRRGYVQRFSLLASRLYPPYRLFDRILFNFPVTLSTAKKEKYDEYGDTYGSRRYKHLGILLSSLGLVVVFCDTSHFKGIHCNYGCMHVCVYVCVCVCVCVCAQ